MGSPNTSPKLDHYTQTPDKSVGHSGLEVLKHTIRNGWPPTKGGLEEKLRIMSDQAYRTYQEGKKPTELFEKASQWIVTIQQYKTTGNKQDVIFKDLVENLCHAIFGSNQIEKAGLHLEETLNLCRRVFQGEQVPDVIEERSEEYRNLVQTLVTQKMKDVTGKHVLRSRREVVQHAKAFQYFIDSIINFNEILSESTLKEAHRILCKGVDIEHFDGTSTDSRLYAGQYRSIPVSAGNTMFTNPRHIGKEMAKLIQDYNKAVATAEESGNIDPFSLASEYCLRFVQIHPFQDGNGRLCRMLLNVILCKYAGIVVSIGENDEERQEYMSIKQRASDQMEGHGELATFVLKKSAPRIRRLKQKLAGKTQKLQ